MAAVQCRGRVAVPTSLLGSITAEAARDSFVSMKARVWTGGLWMYIRQPLKYSTYVSDV